MLNWWLPGCITCMNLHFAGFYSDVVECLPLDPAAQVRFPPQAVRIFLHPVTFGGQCGGECHGARYLTHFYCLAVKPAFTAKW